MTFKNKLIFILIFCLCYSFYGNSQSLVVQWKKNFGGEKNDAISAIVEDDAGDIVLTGENQNEHNQLDLWILKIDKTGKTIWSKTFPKRGHQRAFSILKTETGFIIGGNDVPTGTQARPFILFIDNDGNKTKKITIEYQQELRFTKLKKIGNYFYAIGTTSRPSNDLFTDGVLIKFNKNFDVVWEMKFKSEPLIHEHPITKKPWHYASTAEPRDFLVMNDETLILTGYQSSKKVTDFWTMNIDTKNQKIRWESKINTYYGGNEAFQLVKTPDNQPLMIGTRYDKPKDFTYFGNVIKFDKTTGKVLFSELYQAEKTELFDRILSAFPSKNGCFLIGLTGTNPSRVTTAEVPQDIWVVFIDHDGKMLWEETIPQIGEERGIDFLVTAKNEYFIFAKIYKENGTTDLQVLKVGFP